MFRWRGKPSAALASVLLGCLASSGVAYGAASNTLLWQTNLEQAKQIAAQSNRLILVHFWSPSCIACKQLEKNVFAQPQVQQSVQARFVPVKVNADDWPTTTKQYGITCLPTDLIITSSGQIIGRMVSPPTPDEYLQKLAIAASGAGYTPSVPASAYAAAPATAGPSAMGTTAMGATAPNSGGWMPAAASAPPAYGAGAITPPAEVAATAPNTPATVSPNVAWGAPPAIAANTAAPAVPAYSDSRYGEYYQRFTAASATTNPGASAPNGAAAAVVPPVASPAIVAQPAYQPTNMQPAYAPPAYAPPTYSPPATSQPGIAAGAATTPNFTTPPLALDGYCPVTLVEQQKWQLGDRRWGVVHRGRTYLFAGPEQQKEFLANPDRFSPAISGQDVVMAMDYGQEMSGKRALGVEYQNRIYLFSNEASRQIFAKNPNRYAAEVLQAEAPNPTTTVR
jgi:YHS domain-containing protein/thiol-disulfide isomerase/thioredoxin